MIQFPNHGPQASDELHAIILNIVHDFAPRNITLGHADEMAASLTGQILGGVVVGIEPNDGMPNVPNN